MPCRAAGPVPNLLIVSTNGAAMTPFDMKACTDRGVLVVNQSGGNAKRSPSTSSA